MNERIANSAATLTRLHEQFHEENSDRLKDLVTRLVSTFNGGGQLLLAATGNLQPIAQLTANHFTHRLSFDRPSLPAVALGNDATLAASLTRSSQQQLLLAYHYRSLVSSNHLLLIFSDGNEDPQLTELVRVASGNQPLVLMIPQKSSNSELIKATDLQLLAGTDSPARLLELSLFCGNLLCELVEAELFGV